MLATTCCEAVAMGEEKDWTGEGNERGDERGGGGTMDMDRNVQSAVWPATARPTGEASPPTFRRLASLCVSCIARFLSCYEVCYGTMVACCATGLFVVVEVPEFRFVLLLLRRFEYSINRLLSVMRRCWLAAFWKYVARSEVCCKVE